MNKKIVSTEPKPPKTGYAHNKCYANHLNDCSSKISKEHWVPKCFLFKIFKNKSFNIYIDNKIIPATVSTAGSNILCVRHNTALSNIAIIAEKWFNILEDIFLKKRTKFSPRNYHIDSREFALVLLQIGCGALCFNKQTIPTNWIELLFSAPSKDPIIHIRHDMELFNKEKYIDNIDNIDDMDIKIHILYNKNYIPNGISVLFQGIWISTYINSNYHSPLNKIKFSDRDITIHFI